MASRRRLTIVEGDALDGLEIRSPCTVPWEQMKGSPWVRHCHVCRLNVFNLSELSRAEGLALLERVEGRLCVRIMRRPDGTVITADCWSRLRAARRRGLLAAVATTLVMLPALLWVILQGARNLRAAVLPRVDEVEPPAMVMGQVIAAPPIYQPRPRRWSPPEKGEPAQGGI